VYAVNGPRGILGTRRRTHRDKLWRLRVLRWVVFLLALPHRERDGRELPRDRQLRRVSLASEATTPAVS